MNWDPWLPVFVVLSSFLPGIFIFALQEERYRARIVLNMTGAVLKLVLVGTMLWGVARGRVYIISYSLADGFDCILHGDALSLLFVTLSSGLWLVTTIYALGYLEDSHHRSRFFGFFSICVSATTGIALAGNLLTFLLFYEMLTLSTYPLVVHKGKPADLAAGRVYLIYTLSGGALLFFTIAWLTALTGAIPFAERGYLIPYAETHRETLQVIFFLFIVSLGVKAALVPLHGWLPIAMVAPAPVSALLHAVAVVKAGAFGMVRVVYDVFGIGLAYELGVTRPLAAAASLTIIYGSIQALFQSQLKRRLAYSTISQVSYIALGVAIAGPVGTIGGLVHLVHQGVMKITLFFCAGNLSKTLGIHDIGEMDGVGWRMPWTMTAFTIAALGMIGVPPMAGFISKWYLGTGALEHDQPALILVLMISTLLNAAYFLPIVYVAWFKPQEGDWPDEQPNGTREGGWMLVWPPVVTALLTVLMGLSANAFFSPLQWARMITFREYGP